MCLCLLGTQLVSPLVIRCVLVTAFWAMEWGGRGECHCQAGYIAVSLNCLCSRPSPLRDPWAVRRQDTGTLNGKSKEPQPATVRQCHSEKLVS